MPIADPERDFPGYQPKPGLYALDIDTGELNWHQPVYTRFVISLRKNRPKVGLAEMRSGSKKDIKSMYECSFYYGLSAAPTVANNLVFAGGLDGKLRAYDPQTGTVSVANRKLPSLSPLSMVSLGMAVQLMLMVRCLVETCCLSNPDTACFGQLPGNVLLGYRLKKKRRTLIDIGLLPLFLPAF